MRIFFIISLFLFSSISLFAQNIADVAKIVEVEKAFAQAVAEKGMKAGFLEFLAPEAIMFNPNAVNAREMWSARPDSPASLTWYPVFADVSANGMLGYSTGPGEYRPQGKADTTVYHSEYATIWQRQADGNYKAVLDIGISHGKPTSTDTNWISPLPTTHQSNENKPSATAAAQKFFETAQDSGLKKAYESFAAQDIRLLRDEDFPFVGKKAALDRVKKTKGDIKFSKRMFFAGAADLSYLYDAYTITDKNKNVLERGNLLQVWKLRNGVWEIVLDLAHILPPEKN